MSKFVKLLGRFKKKKNSKPVNMTLKLHVFDWKKENQQRIIKKCKCSKCKSCKCVVLSSSSTPAFFKPVGFLVAATFTTHCVASAAEGFC